MKFDIILRRVKIVVLISRIETLLFLTYEMPFCGCVVARESARSYAVGTA